jgi:hypothetical protein
MTIFFLTDECRVDIRISRWLSAGTGASLSLAMAHCRRGHVRKLIAREFNTVGIRDSILQPRDAVDGFLVDGGQGWIGHANGSTPGWIISVSHRQCLCTLLPKAA